MLEPRLLNYLQKKVQLDALRSLPTVVVNRIT